MAPALGNYECPKNICMTGEAGYGPGTTGRVLQDDMGLTWRASLLYRCGNGAPGRWAGFPDSAPEAAWVEPSACASAGAALRERVQT